MSRTASILTLLSSTFVISCAAGPCHELRKPELAAQQDQKVSPIETAEQTPPAVAPVKPAVPSVKIAEPAKNSNAAANTVLVYKADGSLQCAGARRVSVDEMEKQLNGIKVLSREKRPDGLMHIQVCGSPTGMINVYEIPQSALGNAEKLGFKRFESR